MIHIDGIVFSIEEFSIYDGPGIRTTVFLKGCPLRCSWCHNPEGQKTEPEIIKSPNGCINCGECKKYAVQKSNGVNFTQESITACPNNLLRVVGKKISSQILIKQLLKNQNLLKNGGITFSGGEPLMHGEFLLECLDLLKGKVHTAVQTSGFCDSDLFDAVLQSADYFLYDLKLIKEEDHLKYTGVSNKKILNNFWTLVTSGKEFVPRIPLIPGITDTKENITQIAELLRENNINYAELMSYNKMAGGKYAMLGRKYSPDFDESVQINPNEKIFDNYNIKTKLL